MHTPQQHINLPGPTVTHVPVLYIEESIKSTRPEVTGKYDTDWRVYIVYRYGKYLFMGTRQPVTTSETNTSNTRKHKNKNRLHRSEKNKNLSSSWPVVSLSFNYPSELYHYMSSLFGASKANVTLYVSSAETSACMDDMFTNPSHASLQHLDEERANRKMELVGYDRIRVPAQYFSDSRADKTNIVKQMLLNLDCMCHAPSGMTLSFRCFVDPPELFQPQPLGRVDDDHTPTEPETENINNNNSNNSNNSNNYIYGGDYDNDDYEYDCYD